MKKLIFLLFVFAGVNLSAQVAKVVILKLMKTKANRFTKLSKQKLRSTINLQKKGRIIHSISKLDLEQVNYLELV